MSLRDQIRAAPDRPVEEIDVPEWSTRLQVRGMSAADVIALSRLEPGSAQYTQQLLSCCVCDLSGQPVYPTAADAAELLEKSLPVVQRVLAAARRVNNLIEDDEKKD
jgi:hypothetical protein